MADRQSDSEPRGPGAMIAALIVVAVGVIFLLQGFGVAIPGNWWALFILIPAVFALAAAWKAYDANGRRYGPGVTGPLITTVVLVALTAIFMFNLHVAWNVVWPIVLIVVGLLALGRAYRRG